MLRWLIAFVILVATLPLAGGTAYAQTQDDPVPLGTSAAVGNWDVTIGAVDGDAGARMLASGDTTIPAATAHRFVRVTVTVANRTQSAHDPAIDVLFTVIGSASVGYTTWNRPCGTWMPGNYTVGDVAPGARASFDLCWEVPADEVATLVLYANQQLSPAPPTWFSLGNDYVVPMTATPPDVAIVTGSSRSAPIAAGETGQVGDFLIRVVSVATSSEAVATTPATPAPGVTFVLVRVGVTSIGTVATDPSYGLAYTGVAASGTEYRSLNDDFGFGCGDLPDNEFSVGTIFPGAAVEYSICWPVPDGDLPGLVLRVEKPYTFDTTIPDAWFVLA